MKKLLILSSLAALPLSLHAVTFNLDAELLKKSDGSLMPVTGLVVLTAGTAGTFFGPTDTSFATGSEIVLKKWDLSAFATPGVISDKVSGLGFSGNWDSGDPLKLYWYPTLTLASAAPGAGTSYGSYRDAVGVDGSDAWVTPSESTVASLKFYTSDASFLNTGGSNSAASGRALATVVPEPSAALLLVAAGGILAVRRRHQHAERP